MNKKANMMVYFWVLIAVVIFMGLYLLASSSQLLDIGYGSGRCNSDANFLAVGFNANSINDVCIGLPKNINGYVKVATHQDSSMDCSNFAVQIDNKQVFICDKSSCYRTPNSIYTNSSVYQLTTCGIHTYAISGLCINPYSAAGIFNVSGCSIETSNSGISQTNGGTNVGNSATTNQNNQDSTGPTSIPFWEWIWNWLRKFFGV